MHLNTNMCEQAGVHAQQRGDCFAKSREAYDRGDHAAAKKWSAEGKAHTAQINRLNELAASQAFEANNRLRGRSAAEVDLHGLHVQEAVKYASEAIAQAKREGRRDLTFIVGRGLHSQDGVARLKPAIHDLVMKHNLRCTPGRPNKGCLFVEFTTPDKRGWFDDMCTIM
jgi:DNA-nicking Smr family endonuclease